jgi:predicted methyltransferase
MRTSMSRLLCGAAFAASLTLAGGLSAIAADTVPAGIASAIADPDRPATDKARDDARKTADMMVFAKIKPGQKVLELIPGKFFFTRVLSKVVGPKGHVYAANPGAAGGADAKTAATSISADPHYTNVTDVVLPSGLATVPPVDVIWTAQNYHDFHLARLKMDVPALDKQFFNLLKPGGEFIVIDHAAVDGSGLDVPDKLHRIDEEIVKKEVEGAGFVLEAESTVLRNPADPRTALVFDPSIRGHTDQFVLLFRKPGPPAVHHVHKHVVKHAATASAH